MGDHFHILVRVFPEDKFTDEDILKRFVDFYGDERIFAKGLVPSLRLKLSSLSEFMREIKVGFARFYNRLGYFWGDRFKSVIVENGVTLINCLAYIDLNPLRAGLVERPEQYRWNSLGYHIQTGNEDNFLSLDFGPVECASLSLRELHRAGLKEFGPGGLRSAVPSEFHWAGVLDAQERLKRYRRYVYAAGSLSRPEKGNINVIEDKVLEKERSREFELSKSDRFKYRTRYFTDSGIIRSKEYVSTNYQRFKNLFSSKEELDQIIQNVIRKTNTESDEFEELDLTEFSSIDEQIEFLKRRDRVVHR
jgi:hypothetical protein